LTEIIDKVFDSVKYWQEKKLLFQAIPSDYFQNKNIMIRLLGVTSHSISSKNEAKKDMWNHHIVNGLGDDILSNIAKPLLNDMEFARDAIAKFNRTYIYLDKSLQASRDLALLAAAKEEDINDPKKFKPPILQYMPENYQLDHEISLMATTRNIENLKYAQNLRRNKYFIIDLMNYTFDHDMKQKILRYIDKDLLNDKRFVSRLGCFDNLCEKFHGDLEYVTNAVQYDINILRKIKMFDEAIIKAALKNENYHNSREVILKEIFKYIEKFNHDFKEFEKKTKSKKLIGKLLWEFGEVILHEF